MSPRAVPAVFRGDDDNAQGYLSQPFHLISATVSWAVKHHSHATC